MSSWHKKTAKELKEMALGAEGEEDNRRTARRLAQELALQRFCEWAKTPEFQDLDIKSCIGVGTVHICRKPVNQDNRVICGECWNRLMNYEVRPKAAILEALIMEYCIRFGDIPKWWTVYEVLES